MTRNGSHAPPQENGPQDELQAERSCASPSSNAPRRAYQAPRLRHLGSVRELTLGGTMGAIEGGGTFGNMAGMMM